MIIIKKWFTKVGHNWCSAVGCKLVGIQWLFCSRPLGETIHCPTVSRAWIIAMVSPHYRLYQCHPLLETANSAVQYNCCTADVQMAHLPTLQTKPPSRLARPSVAVDSLAAGWSWLVYSQQSGCRLCIFTDPAPDFKQKWISYLHEFQWKSLWFNVLWPQCVIFCEIRLDLLTEAQA